MSLVSRTLRSMSEANGYNAEERVKLMELLWDCRGSEFGGQHELYESSYGGSTVGNPPHCLFGRRPPATPIASMDLPRSAWQSTP